MWGGWLEAAWVRQWWWCEMQVTGTVLALLTPDAYTVNMYTYTLQSSKLLLLLKFPVLLCRTPQGPHS